MISERRSPLPLVLVDYFKDHTRAVLGELRTPRSQLEERILRGLREHGPSTTRTVQTEILNNAVKYDRVKTTLERLLEDGSVTVAEPRQHGEGRTAGACVGRHRGR
jgi:predicted ArsR family transcriptional regulator